MSKPVVTETQKLGSSWKAALNECSCPQVEFEIGSPSSQTKASDYQR